MALTPKDYDQMTKKASPNTKSWRNIPLAFVIGGLICTLGQGLMELYLSRGLEKDEASAWTSVTLVFLSALLTGLKVYDNIAKYGGAGTLVPITGFANAVVSAAIEFKAEGRVPGTGAKIFLIAGPVIVYGTLAAVVYGAVLWVLGIVCEIMAVLVMNGTLFLPGPGASTWLIIFLVVDLVMVVIGSQLWKRANHLAPASKENKLSYWVQTDLGVIVAAIAFAPVILLLLTNKDLDKGTKKAGAIVAAIALVAAVASGIDYHPATQEDLDQAEAGAAVLSDDGLAYWTPFGEVYHFNPDCQYLKNSGTIYSGTVQDALDAKRTRGCSGCTVEDGTDVLSKADPAGVAAALANVVKVGGDNGSVGGSGAQEPDEGEDDAWEGLSEAA